MSLTHTFFDIIPSIFNVPSPNHELSTLPMQRLFYEGKSFEGLLVSGYGSFTATLWSILFIPYFLKYLLSFYTLCQPYIPYILCTLVFLFIFQENTIKQKLLASYTTLAAGLLGYFSLHSISLTYNLTLLFSGIFALPSLLLLLTQQEVFSIPQHHHSFFFPFPKNYTPFLITLPSVTFTALFPGIGNSQAISFVSFWTRSITPHAFLFCISFINTCNFILSLPVLYLLLKARNGIMVLFLPYYHHFTLDFILHTYPYLLLLITPIIFVLFILFSYLLIKYSTKLPLKLMSFMIIIAIIFFTLITNSYFGIIFLLSSCSLGFFPHIFSIRRIHLLNTLVIPIIIATI